MSIGYLPIPSNDNHVHEAKELCAACEQCVTRQIAEACELNAALKDAYQALLEEVRKYALQLELIAAVVLRPSDAENALIADAHRLTHAVTEAKRQSSTPRCLALLRGGLYATVFFGLGIFMGALMAHGAL
jgi:hypothetical protein